MIRACAAACCLALPALASAAQWTVVPQMNLNGDSDTNRRLLQPPRPSDAAVLSGLLAITRTTEISTLALTPRASVSRYSGDDALDSEDWGLNAAFRRNGERLTFDASAGISDDSTLVTELGETGFVEGNTRRHAANASVSLSQYLATRHMLQYQIGLSDIDYDRTLSTGLVDYRYPSANLMYVAMMSPRLHVTVRASTARLEVPLTRLESDTTGAQLGFRFGISENFDLEASAGRSQTRARGRSDEDQSYSASASWHDERSRFAFSVSQDIEPSGNGILVRAEDLRIEYSRELSEYLTLSTSARVSIREDTQADLRRYEYRYGAAVLALSWRFDEHWTLGVAGSHVRQEYEFSRGSAEGQRVGISLSWRPLQ